MSKSCEVVMNQLLGRVDALSAKVNALTSPVKVYVEVEDGGKLPVYAKPGDAGMDLIANEDVDIFRNSRMIISSGIKVAIPVGYEIQVRPRSGISAKTSLTVANSPGTIDSGYRGTVGVILSNSDSSTTSGVEKTIKGKPTGKEYSSVEGDVYTIRKGDRIAQIVLNKVEEIQWEQIDDISVLSTERGAGGFGSTGTN